MAEEVRNNEKLAGAARAALLEAITAVAQKEDRHSEHVEFLAEAFAAVATVGPVKREVQE
ncbi:hypothetical protein AAIH32_08645 [Pseudarthrobacter oxydans]|uniref:hypothetical protein n=1 Tax=Pseudarthrobacter oxydans TaxID=1671 RepID=UPI003D26524D